MVKMDFFDVTVEIKYLAYSIRSVEITVEADSYEEAESMAAREALSIEDEKIDLLDDPDTEWTREVHDVDACYADFDANPPERRYFGRKPDLLSTGGVATAEAMLWTDEAKAICRERLEWYQEKIGPYPESDLKDIPEKVREAVARYDRGEPFDRHPGEFSRGTVYLAKQLGSVLLGTADLGFALVVDIKTGRCVGAVAPVQNSNRSNAPELPPGWVSGPLMLIKESL